MRATLEQLKAMSNEELSLLWGRGIFPFDSAGCTHCLTTHADLRNTWHRCGIPEHQQLVRSVAALDPTRDAPSIHKLSPYVEELYALRLFYDALYPQTMEAAEEKTIAESAPSLVAQG